VLGRSNDQSQAVSLIVFSGIAFSLETPAVLNSRIRRCARFAGSPCDI
jgi:hypothetical protein